MAPEQMTFDQVVEMEHIPGDPSYTEYLLQRTQRGPAA